MQQQQEDNKKRKTAAAAADIDDQSHKKQKQEEDTPMHPFFDKSRMTRLKWLTVLPTVLITITRTEGTVAAAGAGRAKVAAFDLDGTLIATKSGRKFPKDSYDWRWWDKRIPNIIKELYDDGYRIVIFSNQNGLNSKNREQAFVKKMEDILSQLPMPVVFMAAKAKDRYRKPMTGMWDWFERECNHGTPVDKNQSFYVGDAAGREANWKPNEKKDHSTADRKFAANIGITFYTPEEFFLKEAKAPYNLGPFIPHEYPDSLPLFLPSSTPLVPVDNKAEVIVFVGYPASGKSSFAKRFLVPRGYVYVNQDTLKTKEKCVKACAEALEQGKPVVIDNTNPEISTRALYVDLAKKAGVPVRCFYFMADEHLAEHNNYYRAIFGNNESDAKRELLGKIAFRTFKSKLQPPTMAEGFDELKQINFVFEGDEEAQKNWKQWLV